MIELTIAKKNRIHLPDYSFKKDIENRILLSDFSPLDLQVLEELLFSSLKTSLKKISKSIPIHEDILKPILYKIATTGLITIEEDTLLIDKEMRKYFEIEIARFRPDFKPDFEFLQQLLHKVSIEYLPNWYAIPRTSNHIFRSILEKYLLTPQIFQRYLLELQLDPIAKSIMSDLFKTPGYKLFSSDVIATYNLKRADFEHLLLLLEFHFVACISYEREDDHWVEVITPFYEWHQYLLFLDSTEPLALQEEKIVQREKNDFAMMEQMSRILNLHHQPFKNPLCSLTPKLILVELLQQKEDLYLISEMGKQWLTMSPQAKALYLYRHPANRMLSINADEKSIKEAEKAIKRVLHGKWILFDDFFKGIVVAIGNHSPVELKKTGTRWNYVIPSYQPQDKAFMKAIIQEWFFELGVVALGTFQEKDCFRVTDFGRYFFES